LVPRLPYRLLYQPPYLKGETFPDWGRRWLDQKPFAWLAQLEREVGGRRRRFHLLYLNLEGVGVYWQYFNAQHLAPRYLCLRAASGLGAGNWTDFYRWERALGQAVERNPRKPKFVAAAGGGFNWPWHVQVAASPAWGVPVYARPDGHQRKGGLWARIEPPLEEGV
jgi:hypothetical protein